MHCSLLRDHAILGHSTRTSSCKPCSQPFEPFSWPLWSHSFIEISLHVFLLLLADFTSPVPKELSNLPVFQILWVAHCYLLVNWNITWNQGLFLRSQETKLSPDLKISNRNPVEQFAGQYNHCLSETILSQLTYNMVFFNIKFYLWSHHISCKFV